MSGAVTNVYEGANTVTASDSTSDPAGPFAGLFVTAAGNVKLHTMMGQDVTVAALGGTVIPIACTRVWSTGTTDPTTVLGLYTPQYRQPLNPGTGTVLP